MAPKKGPRKGPLCPAHSKRTGRPCGQYAGWGTDHPGSGNCKLHGGKESGAPIGNKNAVTTGEYETIYVSALNQDEARLFETINARPRPEVERDIKLQCVRIHRMLLRQKRLMEEEELSEDGMHLVALSRESGWDKGEKRNVAKEYQSYATTIFAIEDAINRTLTVKARLITELRAVLKETPEESGGLDAIVDVIDRSAKAIVEAKAHV